MTHSNQGLPRIREPHGRKRKVRSLAVIGAVVALAGALAVAAIAATRMPGHGTAARANPAASVGNVAQSTHSPGQSQAAAPRSTMTPASVGKPSSVADAALRKSQTGTCTSSNPVFAVGRRTWPNCKDTGVPAGTRLRKMSSPRPTGDGNSYVTNIRRSGTVINGVDLTGSFDVYANNVTIENSRITSRNWWGINLRAGYTGLRVLHCTIIGVAGAGLNQGGEDYGVSSSGGPVEVGWSNIEDFGDAIALSSGNIHDNYVHNLQAFVPIGSGQYNHDDAMVSNGGSGLKIEHNTLLNQLSPSRGASGSIGLFADYAAIKNVTINDNYIAGGAFALFPGGGPTSRNVVVTDNVFSTLFWTGSGFYGPVSGSYWHYGGGNIWSGNIWVGGRKSGRRVRP